MVWSGEQGQLKHTMVVRPGADPAAIKGPGYLNFFGWALLDRRTGQATGSANRETATNTTESMLKVWLAADYLRHTPAPGGGALAELHTMIVDSDDNLALKYYQMFKADPKGFIPRYIAMVKNGFDAPPAVILNKYLGLSLQDVTSTTLGFPEMLTAFVNDAVDFGILATNFGTSGKYWNQGDFNYDGTVNSLDSNILATSFGQNGFPT